MSESTSFAEIAKTILAENTTVLAQVDGDSVRRLADLILAAPRVYVLGEGRTGLIGQALAMRLMHLGKQSYVVGAPTTPSVRPDDLLIALSGSGETAVTCLLADTAGRAGAIVTAITAVPDSRLAKTARQVLIVPAKKDAQTSIQFGGSLFEQSTLLVCDSLIVLLMRLTGAVAADLHQRHTNLE